jgi:4-alpha-glucanotransferase
MRERASGILCHITSLPSALGIGDLGPAAYQWIDFLAAAQQRWWQVLPVGPFTVGDCSPYRPASAFAGNPLLVSPELLEADGMVTSGELAEISRRTFPSGHVDFALVEETRTSLLDRACRRFFEHGDERAFDAFCERHEAWLEPFAQVRVEGQPGDRDELARREMCIQFFFEDQWSRLRAYAHARDVHIFGDVPFYVDHASADVVTRPELFKLDAAGRPRTVSGVPPDAFSATGQLWGNPVYDWEAHARSNHAWWVARIRRSLEWFDLVRLDHFRAFAAHWEVPAGSTTAMDGAWADGPGKSLLDSIVAANPMTSLVAEDLGTITDDVRELMTAYELPGMKVLLFAFDGDTGKSEHAPHRHVPNAVVYTGTHDNNTARGWFENDAGPASRAQLARYLGREPLPSEVSEALVRMAMASVCRLAILPIQDVLGLDGGSRMNHPAASNGSWRWRLEAGRLTPQVAQYLADMTSTYGRI